MSTFDDRCPVSGPSGVIYTPDRTGQLPGTRTGQTGQKPDKKRTQTGQLQGSRPLPSPLRSIRLKCLDCCLGSAQEVNLCPAGIYCSLHPYRRGRPTGMKEIHPLRIIREYCLQCGEENSRSSVESCPVKDCPLYPYRLGKHPGRKSQPLTLEKKAILRERLARARGGKNA